jgi:hypothetical protein
MQIWKRQQLWLLLELGAIKLDCEIASFHGGMVKAKKTCKPNIILGKLLTNLAGMNLMPLETFRSVGRKIEKFERAAYSKNTRECCFA